MLFKRGYFCPPTSSIIQYLTRNTLVYCFEAPGFFVGVGVLHSIKLQVLSPNFPIDSPPFDEVT